MKGGALKSRATEVIRAATVPSGFSSPEAPSLLSTMMPTPLAGTPSRTAASMQDLERPSVDTSAVPSPIRPNGPPRSRSSQPGQHSADALTSPLRQSASASPMSLSAARSKRQHSDVS